jgi:dihydroorotate dehydrogenase (NAD+) catalytic subunit
MNQTTALVPAQETIDLSVAIGALRLRNPVVAASGTFGYGDEFAGRFALDRIGGIVTKTLTLEPRAGNPPHRMVETASGMLNSIGLENVGVRAFVERKLPRLRELPCARIVSVGGETPEELEQLIDALEEHDGPDGYEVNFSCPNVRAGGARFWADAERLESTCARLGRRTRRSLWAKLSPNVTDPALFARAAEAGGADAVSLVNTFVGTAVDLATRTFRLGTQTGGLSGPAIKPLALAQVYEVSGAVKIPVVGMGGVSGAADVMEFLVVGATAVQVGTAHFFDPAAGAHTGEQLADWCRRLGVRSVRDLVRTVRHAPEGTHAG